MTDLVIGTPIAKSAVLVVLMLSMAVLAVPTTCADDPQPPGQSESSPPSSETSETGRPVGLPQDADAAANAAGDAVPVQPSRDPVQSSRDPVQSSRDPVQSSRDPVQPSRDPVRLPSNLPDGRVLRTIAFFKSQMAELIPDHYRPVSIERLQEAITRLTDRATDDRASRLKGAVYWVELVDDTLVSDRSVIDIESDRDTVIRRSLGNMNLAIDPPQSRSTGAALTLLPRLESEPSGNLVAVFQGGAAAHTLIEFKWRLHGKSIGTGHEFLLRLPRTPQTRIVLSAPAGIMVESFDGVLRARPGPPPDASEIATNSELRWYEIDAGGLASVRLRTQKREAKTESESMIVRRSSIQYEADASGVTWTSRMVVQLPPDRQLPPLVILSGASVTSVKVNTAEALFTSKSYGISRQQIEIALPSGAINLQAVSATITITGQTTWNDRDGWCELPLPMWIGERIVQASAVDEAQLAVVDPLQVMSWELPAGWNETAEQTIDGGVRLYGAEGPPLTILSAQDAADLNDAAMPKYGWSRVRLVERPRLRSSDTSLRLTVTPGSVTAKTRIAVSIDPSRIEPMRLSLQNGWTLESVSFAHSGRVMESPNVNESLHSVTLWPEAEDVLRTENSTESLLVVEATGSRVLPTAPSGLTIPPTWFVRMDSARGAFVAAIDPPAELNWSGEAAMQPGRVKVSDLNATQRTFLQGLGPETLYFASAIGRTPEVLLETPSVSFDVATELRLSRDRDEVAESFVVDVQSAGQTLRQLTIQTGPAEGRPDYLWSLSGESGAPSTSLPPSDVSLSSDNDRGIYTIDVSDQNIRGRRLIARRRFPITPQLALHLPSVPGAASQRSELLVGPGMVVKQKSRGVQLIPTRYSTSAGNAIDDSASTRSPRASSSTGNDDGFVRLRYDAVEQPSVVIAKTDVNANVTIVWREQVNVIASSRGTDRIEATYKVTPTAPLQIDYDLELQLASITRDGEPVDLGAASQSPIELQPRNRTETIHIVWNRSQYGSSWIRRCRIPRVMISGTVLKSEYQLISSSDTFAPAELLGVQRSDGQVDAVDTLPGQSVTLVRRNIALAMGWLIALITFVIVWIAADHAPLVVAASVAVLATIVVLWWPWKLAVIGWLIVPSITAALLATTRAWSDRGSDLLDRDSSTAGGDELRSGDGSSDFSWEAMIRIISFMLATLWWVGRPAAAQESLPIGPAAANSPAGPVNLLVPVDDNGFFSGEIVYIPRSVQALLFQTNQPTEPQEPRFQSASYRVKITTAAAPNTSPEAASTIEAEYLLHVEDANRSTNLVRLPILATAVRRVELIDDVSRMIRFNADSSGQMIATLPKGNAFRLRLTLLPMTSQADQWTKLFLSIPPVASSRLTIESERNIEALRVGGTNGRLLSETDLRRWVEDLGPVNTLDIDYRSTSVANASTAKPMQRRYWISASKTQVTIDCEVEPPAAVTAGETFQFVIRDSEMPKVNSLNWRLVGSELYSPTRRLITFKSVRDTPGPIRLLWTRATKFNQPDTANPESILVPEVIAAALGENAPAWIALHSDPTLRFAPMIRETTEPLSVDHFVAQWSGYRGRIDRAFISLAGIPALILQSSAKTEPLVTQQHHLHVMPDQLQVEYDATLIPSQTRHTLAVPRGLELMDLTIDGREIDSNPVRSGETSEYLLGSFAGPDPVAIRAVAVQTLPSNRRFSPPRLSIWPPLKTSDSYTISRDRSTTLRELQQTNIEATSSQPAATALSLAQGWIPVATWSMDSEPGESGSAFPGGLFEARARKTRFDCQQLISLFREDGRWRMETRVQFNPNGVPDFINVEMPTRWCESLNVKPTTSWSRQPSIDSSLQIIRIRCDADELRDQTLTFTGQLQSSDAGRIGVPSVRILGLGKRQVHISVPDRLTNEQIQWRTSAVEAVELPAQWRGSVTAAGQRSTYLVANRSWSIELAPLPELNADAIAVTQDTQVFTQNDGVLVICHWDLFPGGLETVDVRLPRSAICLGAWSAGKVVLMERVERTDSTVNQRPIDNIIRIPLALSRMSQPIEILLRVPASPAKQADYLPQLIEIPVTQSWLANYEPAGASNLQPSDNEDAGKRALALARSVVESVEQAVDVIAERPAEEVATWLEPWFARYRDIADSVGHTINLDPQPDAIPTVAATSPPMIQSGTPQRLSLPNHLQWKELDGRMAPYVDRFLPAIDNLAEPVFGVANFDGFESQRITRLSAVNRPRSVQPVSTNNRGLRNMLVNILTLLVVCGLLVCLGPLRRFIAPLVVHPAFWLGLLGIFSFAVAPVSVAAALLLVAVAMLVFPTTGRTAVRRTP